tara:strand:+ start:2855 stop:3640 length:786 start_codon:yes stop_codon:yes gene_type:complete
MDIRAHNRAAWDRQVENGNQWTIPVTSEEVEAARRGDWSIYLTPKKAVPRSWFPDALAERDVLCLASGGGQQGPILAAGGAKVTVYDNSPAQLRRDAEVAERDDLSIRTIEGDMRDLSAVEDDAFDLIVHPVSNVFIPDVHPVWREAVRVLRSGGAILAGFTNPAVYLFDEDRIEKDGSMIVAHRLPYSDTESLTEEEIERRAGNGDSLQFSHTLQDLIGGQTDAGLLITGFYGDRYRKEDRDVTSKVMDMFFATRAIKPA